MMYPIAISVLKKAVEDVKMRQMSVAEDCRDGVLDEKQSLTSVVQLQDWIFQLESAVELLESIDEDDFSKEEEAFE